MGEVDAGLSVGADLDHLGHALAPGQDIGMVFVGADQHNRPWPGLGRALKAEKSDQLVDRAGHARAGEDHLVGVARVETLADIGPRRFARPRRLPATETVLGMAIGIGGQDLVADVILDLGQRPTRGGVVRIDQRAGAERPVERHAFSDQPGPDPVDRRRAARAVQNICEWCHRCVPVALGPGPVGPPAFSFKHVTGAGGISLSKLLAKWRLLVVI